MSHAPDPIRYVVIAAVLVLGALLALADWRWIRRPVCGLLLLSGVAGGYSLTIVSPFDFVTGGYYMQGALLSAGSALALLGYAVVSAVIVIGRLIGGWRRP